MSSVYQLNPSNACSSLPGRMKISSIHLRGIQYNFASHLGLNFVTHANNSPLSPTFDQIRLSRLVSQGRQAEAPEAAEEGGSEAARAQGRPGPPTDDPGGLQVPVNQERRDRRADSSKES